MNDRATFKRFVMEYNGKVNTEFGVEIIARPDIPSPELNVNYIKIAGRESSLTETDGSYNDITFPVKMNYIAEPRLWNDKKRALTNWLRPSGKLTFSDDPDVFYKIKNISFSEVTRQYKRAGGISANFTCDPFVYFYSGQFPIECTGSSTIITNPYLRSKPIYNLLGNGQCSMSVNGNAIVAQVCQSLFIDTERLIAYKADDLSAETLITGEYEEKFDLLPGRNTISISSGFSVKVIPNWRILA